MKKFTILALFMAFGIASVFAQVKEGSASMSKGSNNAFAIELRQTEAKEVTEAWTKYIKEYKGKTKFDKKSKEVFSDNAEIRDMSSNTVDVYGSVQQRGENTVLTVWFDLGGAFLSSSMHGGEKAAVAEKLLNKFAGTVSTAALEDEIKAQEKVVKNLEGDLKGLQKDKEGHEKEIEKCEQKIKEAKESIVTNLEDQKNKQVEIETEKKVLDSLLEKLKKIKK